MGHRLLLVGCGKMGGALLDGWLRAGIVDHVDVVEPSVATLPRDPRVVRHDAADAVADAPRPEIVVIAVKPQVTDTVVPAYRRFVAPGTAFVSIAAGRTLGYFGDLLGAEAAVVRAMPNTPAAIGQGISVMVANDHVDDAQRHLAGRLMAAAGAVEWVEDEGLIDAVTALSGGGPAYVFLLIETLAQAGAAAGLPTALAMRLARQTVVGSGALAAASEEAAATLRRNVTSPGGTTQAALEVLMAADGVQPLFDRAIAAATKRSRELAG
ncbi:MAG: pyrroline-5-carboxylate reductase [Inquilinus sp.]|nr:pyrroline-5-carboxylate reductase [Inquilinus sp.]